MTPEAKVNWQNVAQSAPGKRVLVQLIRELGELSDVFCAGAPDKTAYMAGRASAAGLIRCRLNEVSPTLYHEIMIEILREENLTKKQRSVEGDV